MFPRLVWDIFTGGPRSLFLRQWYVGITVWHVNVYLPWVCPRGHIFFHRLLSRLAFQWITIITSFRFISRIGFPPFTCSRKFRPTRNFLGHSHGKSTENTGDEIFERRKRNCHDRGINYTSRNALPASVELSFPALSTPKPAEFQGRSRSSCHVRYQGHGQYAKDEKTKVRCGYATRNQEITKSTTETYELSLIGIRARQRIGHVCTSPLIRSEFIARLSTPMCLEGELWLNSL